ncbi:DUF4625 domain-containing protein [Marinifilum fragile]|uniref:DUF4625 domain-containing protein n=1 Tax=Marinifilum fragile TaxID=570161 RepID=UPI002AA5EF5E|nr:DUF4625 domain-containing protein [Marinifilum fragile]
MKRILTLLIVATTLFSCSKNSNDDIKPEGKLYDVSFNVSGFNKDVTNFKSSNSLSDKTKYLHYFIYKGSNLVSRKQFEHTDANFGTIQDKFTEGEYTVVFIGMNFPITEENMDGEEYYEATEALDDTFYKSIELNIPNDDTEISVELERIVGKIEVIFTDAMPQEVDRIEYSILGRKCGIQILNAYPEQDIQITAPAIKVTDDEKGKENYQLDIYSFAQYHPERCEVTIKCLAENDEIIAIKTIKEIEVFRNKITRISGKMFDEVKTGNNFNITISDVWEESYNRGFDNTTIPQVTVSKPNSSAFVQPNSNMTVTFNAKDDEELKSYTLKIMGQAGEQTQFSFDSTIDKDASGNDLPTISGKNSDVSFDVAIPQMEETGFYMVITVEDTKGNTKIKRTSFVVRL